MLCPFLFQVISFLKTKATFLDLVLKHMDTSAMMDLLLRLISCVEPAQLRQEVLNVRASLVLLCCFCIGGPVYPRGLVFILLLEDCLSKKFLGFFFQFWIRTLMPGNGWTGSRVDPFLGFYPRDFPLSCPTGESCAFWSDVIL